MPRLVRHTTRGSFDWKAPMRSLSVSDTLRELRALGFESDSKPLRILMLPLYMPFTSDSSTSGSMADIGPCIQLW